jgi:hypothetical protein
MGAAPKQKPWKYSQKPSAKPDTQENLRLVKMESEQIKEKIENRILDNPKIAKKAALLLALWMVKKSKKDQKSKK